HPDQLQLLRENPDLMDSAIEEVQRFNGPIGGTKPNYALEDVTLKGVTIPRGAMVLPVLSAANHDPVVFESPEIFDITRSPNRHMGFGMGVHYCLGSSLARLEVKIALSNLLERNPNLRLAIPLEQLEKVSMPFQTRYRRVPVLLG
ncbi:MAG: cytochrome P450, partial [Thiolinea sp.]